MYNSQIVFFSLLTVVILISTTNSCPEGKLTTDCDVEFVPPKEAINQLAENGWEKYEGNPVFTKSVASWDSAGVTCFVVRHFPWAYMMYYTGSGAGHHTGYGLATSEDGIHWERYGDGPVIEPDSGYALWGPEVIHNGEQYMMWYVARAPGENEGSQIYHCTSEDGIDWVHSENNPVIDHGGCNAVIWDTEHEQYRMFLQSQTRVGRESRSAFQLLTSDDGEAWEAQGFPFLAGTVGSWDEITAAPSIAYYENQLHLWYTGADTQGNRRGEIAIGHVVSDDWGESFLINDQRRAIHRELRPTVEWEGRGIYSSGVDYDGENIYIWYAAQGFGYASRPVNTVRSMTEIRSGVNLWSVSPNPASGPVKINYLGTMDAPVTVSLFDLNGRRLIRREFSPNQPIRFDPAMLGLPIGQYLLKIDARGNEIHKRMVVLR